MLKLFVLPSAGWGVTNPSPFCMKVQTYLRMTQLPFESIETVDLRKAPKGKVPYLDDGGHLVPDSGQILEYLKARHGDPLDGRLDANQRATAHLLRRMMEENLYWTIVYSRWADEAGWAVTRRLFFEALPFPARQLAPRIARKQVLAQLHSQGMGRHSTEEVYQRGDEDLSALSAVLGEKAFFLGEAPSSVDAIAYAFLANLLQNVVQCPLSQRAREKPNLVAFCERMKARFFAEPGADRRVA